MRMAMLRSDLMSSLRSGGAENLRYEDHFAPVICRVTKPSIMARLLRIVERSGDKVALQSLLDGLYDWCVY